MVYEIQFIPNFINLRMVTRWRIEPKWKVCYKESPFFGILLWRSDSTLRINGNIDRKFSHVCVQGIYQWIGLREHLQETIDFPMKYGGFLLKKTLNPIHWIYGFLQALMCSEYLRLSILQFHRTESANWGVDPQSFSDRKCSGDVEWFSTIQVS
jgi:hypothetical protein